MTIHFVVHDEGDSVGVVVVEGLKAGQPLTGWIMDQDKMIEFRAQNDIPIGHKLAIKRWRACPWTQHQDQALVRGRPWAWT